MSDYTQILQSPDAEQLQTLNRQQQFAQALMNQGLQGQPQGQVVSGYYVKPSITQALNPLVQSLTGAYLNKQAEQKQLDLANALRGKQQDVQQQIMDKINAGDQKGALAIATQNAEYGGKDFVSSLMSNVIPKETENEREYKLAKEGGFKGTFNDYKNQITPYQQAELNLRGSELNKGQVVETPQGAVLINPFTSKVTPLSINGQPIMGKGNATESQSHAAAFQNSALDASRNMSALEQSGFNPASLANQTKVSLAGGGLNIVQNPQVQQYKQAQDQFANAYLRFQSGANMSEPEIKRNLANMMPSIGDSPQVVAQKANARQEAIKSMGMAAGPLNMLNNPMYQQQAPQGQVTVQGAPSQQQAAPVNTGWGKATVVGQ